MKANFFEQIESLSLPGTWRICIEPGLPMVLSVLYQQPCADPVAKAIPVMVMRGDPKELDEHFFETIGKPLQESSGLMTSIDQFSRELDAVRLQSRMEKAKEEKAKAAKMESEKKYDAAMKAVEELKSIGKYREARAKLPKPEIFPEKASDILKHYQELSANIEPDLFTALN